ncbi:DUF3035 domain-containing protein [Limimaricola hongkongensis]|uniref:Argininosuccinate lyase n=1 Tax=Limimaricola hongkongensis DSM 17492 TaxID=1122180 RepID=A0A017HFC5_9RHOB|nr:DUF3035 domain-containing protein [Limimaricola hongkongensis]EYD73005.1 hypothetical protein Lokhon_00530 [Limimaricola hongkongensis DSM 17492]
MRLALAAGLFALTLAACGGSDGPAGPDPNTVVPQQPLEIPARLDLPPPAPGSPNRAAPAASEIALRTNNGETQLRPPY